jgi:hypothetical protein
MTILREFQRKHRLQVILILSLGVFIVIMGVLALGSTNPEPKNVNALTDAEIIDDTFVTLTAFAPLVEFAVETVGNTTYTYLIIAVSDPDDNVRLMALRVTETEAETIWAYVDENATEAVWIDDLSYHGMVYDLPSEATGFYDEGLEWLEVDAEFPVLQVVLEAVKGDYVANTTEPLIIGITFMAAGGGVLAVAILAFGGFFHRKTRRLAGTMALGGDGDQWLNAFEAQAVNTHGVYVSKEALLYPAGIGSVLVKADDVVWAYGHKQDATLYFVIKVATHHFVMLRTSAKKSYLIPCKTKGHADALFATLQAQWPNVVLGYHKDLEKVYKANPAAFIQAVQALDA